VARSFIILVLLLAGAIRAQPQTLPLPVTLNGQELGQITGQIENNQLVSLDISPIKDQLQQLLSPERFQALATNRAPMVTLLQLERAGVQTRFDYQNLSVHLQVAAAQRRSENLNLIGNPGLTANRTQPPSVFSAYMNLRGGVDYVEPSAGAQTGFTTPQLALENAFNVRGLVLENETAINPLPDKPWEKRDTRLTWDQPEKRWRWTLGDLNYPVNSFQSFLPMAGLSFHREDSLQPYYVTSPLGQSAFFLKQDSKVDILVNGRTIQTLQMAAGPHQISNFPLTAGANNVILRITDPVGRVEYVNANLFYDPGLLKAGGSEFNYAVGFPSLTDPENPFYQYKPNPAASAFQRWGLNDSVTLGVNAQATKDTQQGGAQGILATRAGTFTYDAAFSHDTAIGCGHFQRLQYNYYAPHDSLLSDANFNLSAQYQSSRFTSPNPFITPVTHTSAWGFDARYTQRITESWNAGIAYAIALQEDYATRQNYSLTVAHHWGRTSASAIVQRMEGGSSPSGWGVFLSLMIDLGRGHSGYATYDSSTHTTRGEWQYTPPANYGTFSTTLGEQNNAGQNDLYGSMRYLGRRIELDLSQDSLINGAQRTGLRWGTALVYADGLFGVSRPVQDSFAIVNSTGSLHEDGGIGVQRQGDHFTGEETWLGPAVLSEITSYYRPRVEIEPRRPDAEFDPQQGDVMMTPTYRSGTHIRLGQNSSANVTAVLVWADGKPAALQSALLRAEDGKTSEFISNREGLMFIHGLPAGTYTGTLAEHPGASFKLIIPTNKHIDVDLGNIQVHTSP
jgi:outer membrane usher protein